MPVHDWKRVDSGLFHAFHFYWIGSLCDALNAGRLPNGYFALPEQNIKGPIPDVLALKLSATADDWPAPSGGMAVAEAPPSARITRRSEASTYAEKADHIVIRHRHGDIVAVIEIVSPGNKSSKSAFKTFVEKSTEYLRQHVHLLVIDLHLPTNRDPQGVHPEIWGSFAEDDEERFELSPEKPLTLVSYDAGPPETAYVENVGVGDPLPEMPIFLRPEIYVPAPLETTYLAAWDKFPTPLKSLLT